MLKMGKKKYFTTIKRGEISEWRKELHSSKEGRQKEAVKKIVAAMTSGKDVGMLFTDVINCSQTNNVELKKLVYLYMLNYAPQNSELAILAVSSLVKDLGHHNSLIRGLALRTMSGIGVDEVLEYLTEPLKSCLKDTDPYVRKVAALAVGKYYVKKPNLALEHGLVEDLEKLLKDPNSMVVGNTVLALCEISRHSKVIDLQFTEKTVKTIILALDLSAEWSQVHFLDALSTYQPTGEEEAEMILEKVIPRLQHSNPSVVMCTVKVVLNLWNLLKMEKLKDKIKKPLLTLVSNQKRPEIMFAVLRNVQLVLDRFPKLLGKELKYFYCSFDDPLYVKLEKLKVIKQLSSSNNFQNILIELRDYCNEVDITFVKAAISVIGQIAIKIPDCVDKCIPILIEIINSKVDYSVQQSIVVLREIVQNYPKRFESVFKTISSNLEVLEDNDAKAAMLWLIAEYFELIENAIDVIKVFVSHFSEQHEKIQFQLLNTCIKIFLTNPGEETKQLLETVLNNGTENWENVDLRDKCYLYFRLISSGTAKKILLEQLPKKIPEKMNPKLFQTLLTNFTKVSSILHKDPTVFVVNYKKAAIKADEGEASDSGSESSENEDEGEGDEDEGEKEKEEESGEDEVEGEDGDGDGDKSTQEGNLLQFF